MTVKFATDTASISIFDEAALRHRLDGPADWWADPAAEVLEVNKGNVIFVDLGTDGTHTARVHTGAQRGEVQSAPSQVGARIKCLSGRLFLGAGEETVGAGSGPDTNLGGRFLEVSPGVYHVALTRAGQFELEVMVEAVAGTAENFIQDSLML